MRSTHAPTRWVWLAAWPVTAVFVLSNAATPLYVLWQHRLGFSKGTLTLVFACYILGLLGSLLVSGIASDRLGRRPVLLPALILALAACALFATATTVVALMVARLLTGIAVGAAVSAGMAAVTDVAGPGRQRLAALLASCAMVFGAGLGPFLAGLLSETAPAPTVTVFAVEAALLVTAMVAVIRMPLPHPTAAAKGSWVRPPRVPRANRLSLVLGIAVFAPGITATSFVLSLGPSLLAGLLGTTNRIVAGTMAFVMFLAATGVQFAVQRLPRRTILLLGAASTILSMLLLTVTVHTASVLLLIATAVLAGAGQGMGQLGGLSLLNSTVPAHRLAEANAALNVGGYLLAGTLPVAAGYLSDGVGLSAGSGVFAAVLLVLAVIGGAVVATRPTLPPSRPLLPETRPTLPPSRPLLPETRPALPATNGTLPAAGDERGVSREERGVSGEEHGVSGEQRNASGKERGVFREERNASEKERGVSREERNASREERDVFREERGASGKERDAFREGRDADSDERHTVSGTSVAGGLAENAAGDAVSPDRAAKPEPV